MGWNSLWAGRWIISRRVDGALIIGSSLAGYVFLLLNLVLGVPHSYLWWFWSVGFDGTHIFGTATRTFFDRRMRAAEKRLLFGSLATFFAIGPLMVLAGLRGWLALLVGVWAYYHVLRQHYGFLMLYNVKAGEADPEVSRRDARFLYLMLIFPPFNRFFVQHPEELGLPPGIALRTLIPGIEAALWLLVAGSLSLYVAGLVRRARTVVPLNLPKLLLLLGVVPLHWLTFSLLSWRAAVPTVTIVHNLQYHALIWFHNRNRYGCDGERFGPIPQAVSGSLAMYLIMGLAFSLLYRIPGYELGRVSDLAFGFFCGFGLTHYYLDSKIWRVRGDRELRLALRLT